MPGELFPLLVYVPPLTVMVPPPRSVATGAELPPVVDTVRPFAVMVPPPLVMIPCAYWPVALIVVPVSVIAALP